MKHQYILPLLKNVCILIAGAIIFSVSPVAAGTQIVNTQNTSFSPNSFTINLGDTVKWVRINGSHTTTSTTIPAGAAVWNSNLNNVITSFTYVPAVVGTYNFKCTPHTAMGMTGSFTVVCGTPSVTISAGGPTTFCQGGSVTLSKSSAPNYTSYQWQKDGGSIFLATNTSYSATSTGSYQLVTTNSCGNSGTSNSINVTVNKIPSDDESSISANGPTTFCKGGNVVLTVETAGLTYQWKKGNNNVAGATLQSYTATKSGNYKCDVSNSCGTNTSNSISVTVNTTPTSSVSADPCSGGTVLLTCTPTPATGITFQWKKGNNNISGATNSTHTTSQSGTYKCVVTITATGCTKQSSGVSVTIDCKNAGPESIEDKAIIVYPNPTSEYFIFNASEFVPGSMISIYDLSGKLVESTVCESTDIKAGGTLSPGIYLARIAMVGKPEQIVKLVKNF